MARCRTCDAWWSAPHDSVTYVDDKPAFTTAKCPCGGELGLVDMAEHAARLPYLPFDPNKK